MPKRSERRTYSVLVLAEGIVIKEKKHEQHEPSNPVQSQAINKRNVPFGRVINKGFRDFS